MTDLQDELLNCESKLVQESCGLMRAHQNFLISSVDFNTQAAELNEARSRIESVISGLQWLLDVPLTKAEKLVQKQW